MMTNQNEPPQDDAHRKSAETGSMHLGRRKNKQKGKKKCQQNKPEMTDLPPVRVPCNEVVALSGTGMRQNTSYNFNDGASSLRIKLPPIYNVATPSLVHNQHDVTSNSFSPTKPKKDFVEYTPSPPSSSGSSRCPDKKPKRDSNVKHYKYQKPGQYSSLLNSEQPEFVLDSKTFHQTKPTNLVKTSEDFTTQQPLQLNLCQNDLSDNSNSNNSTLVIQPHTVILPNNEMIPFNRKLEHVKLMSDVHEGIRESANLHRVEAIGGSSRGRNSRVGSSRAGSSLESRFSPGTSPRFEPRLLPQDGLYRHWMESRPSTSKNITTILEDKYNKQMYLNKRQQMDFLRQHSSPETRDCVEELHQEQKLQQERQFLEKSIRKVSVYQPTLQGQRQSKKNTKVDLSFVSGQKTLPTFDIFYRESLPPIGASEQPQKSPSSPPSSPAGNCESDTDDCSDVHQPRTGGYEYSAPPPVSNTNSYNFYEQYLMEQRDSSSEADESYDALAWRAAAKEYSTANEYVYNSTDDLDFRPYMQRRCDLQDPVLDRYLHFHGRRRSGVCEHLETSSAMQLVLFKENMILLANLE